MLGIMTVLLVGLIQGLLSFRILPRAVTFIKGFLYLEVRTLREINLRLSGLEPSLVHLVCSYAPELRGSVSPAYAVGPQQLECRVRRSQRRK